MSDYKKMYVKLAVAMANSIEEMQKAMQEAEEIYMENENAFNLRLLQFSQGLSFTFYS